VKQHRQSEASATRKGIAQSLQVFPMLALGLLSAFFAAPSAWAQGCVLCYTSAAAGGPGAASAFKWGVLTLLVPALVLFASVFVLIFRRSLAASQAEPRPIAHPAVSWRAGLRKIRPTPLSVNPR
jgi:hypothetical protein